MSETEEALHLSEERFRLAMKGANDGLWDWDLRTDAVYYSPAWKSMLGYAEDELAGNLATWKSLTHPDDIAPTLAHVQDLVEGRTDKYEVEFRMRHKDGQYRNILSRGFLLHNPGGDAIRLIGTHVDVTDRVRANERIATLSRLYATLSACNSAVVHATSRHELCERICHIVTDKGGWTGAWIGFLDETTRSIAVEAWSKSLSPVISRMVVSIDPTLPEGRGPTSIAARTGTPYFCNDVFTDPATVPWRDFLKNFGVAAAAAVPLRVEGQFTGVMNMYSGRKDFYTPEVQALLNELSHDISFALDSFVREERRNRAESALVENEAKYRGLVEQHITGIYFIQNGAFVYANPRFAEIFGYEQREIIGMKVSELVAEPYRELVLENIRKRLVSEIASIEYEFTGQRKDGTFVEIGVHGTAGVYNGKPAIIGVLQDISAKKRAEEEIQRYVKQLKTAFMSTVEVATIMSEMRDPYTAGHERRVAEIAVAIGAELGFDARRLEGLRVAGHLHDIGKVTIPSEILAKPGKLSSLEFQLIRAHAQAGYDVLKNVEFPWPVAQVALQHHERIDGSGYPLGLKGEAILLESRIMAVADVVEAMSSHRPYRAGLGIEKALAEIERGRGTAYDADAADACLRLFREGRYRLPA
jgi:PAS domain S-box-containing protein